MAQFVRVIPNRLYNDLIQEGVIDINKYFPAAPKSREQCLLELVPETLRDEASKLLKRLSDISEFDWNDAGEIIYKQEHCLGSNLPLLLAQLLLEDKTVTDMPGWDCIKNILSEIGYSSDQFDKHSKIVDEQSGKGDPLPTSEPDTRKQQPNRAFCHWTTFEDLFVFV
jgi:hypothetical protein